MNSILRELRESNVQSSSSEGKIRALSDKKKKDSKSSPMKTLNQRTTSSLAKIKVSPKERRNSKKYVGKFK